MCACVRVSVHAHSVSEHRGPGLCLSDALCFSSLPQSTRMNSYFCVFSTRAENGTQGQKFDLIATESEGENKFGFD